MQHSNSSGLYLNTCTVMPDSSTVNDCKNYGIYYTGCGAKVMNDSIENNSGGGLYIGTSCGITIKSSYFYNNSSYGAIYSPNHLYNPVFVSNNYFDNNNYDNVGIITLKSSFIKFEENYFINNSFSGSVAGLISLENSGFINDTISSLLFMNNHIDNNAAGNGTFIMVAEGFRSCVIRGNSFANNSVGDGSATAGVSCTFDTLECNLFLNNQGGNNAYGALTVDMDGPTFISKNIFAGNYNFSANQTTVARIDCSYGGTDTCYFVNNTIRNNLGSYGPCIEFIPHITNQEALQIHDNNFVNNIANGVIKLTGNNTGNVNLDFIYLKHNNFSDPNSKYEIYNNVPYGSPNVYADSNYWNGTSNQHLDSVIYDYFDSGNLSVLFYQPALSSPVIIDTSCTNILTTVPAVADNSIYSSPYPNPFSNHTTLVFEKELSDAILTVFNGVGQKVKELYHLRGYNIQIDREKLPAGIYFYEVMDKAVTAGNGKLVIID